MAVRNFTLYLGHKWINITVGKIIRLFGIMLMILFEPCKMDGYPPYFMEDTIIQLGCAYYVELRDYNA